MPTRDRAVLGDAMLSRLRSPQVVRNIALVKRLPLIPLLALAFATAAVSTAAAAAAGAQAASSAPATAVLTVEMSRPGPAVSPYLYGQFIEHLGRCIHDGIWAEKLQDRKFLMALDKSPWQVVRTKASQFDAFLDAAGAYAGEHCLALWRRAGAGGACGVMQNNIGMIAGREYVGYAVVAAVNGEPELEARLAWGQDAGQSVRVAVRGREYRRATFRFRAGATTESGSFSLHLTRPGFVWVGCVSLMSADNIQGMRSDVLALIKELNPPITRWPGGNFVSGYNWKDGVGERDRRPPRWERAWNAVEDNDFGLDEFMRFCAEVKTEPYIAVNTGLGSVQDAADEVEYATGSKRTRWGAVRAANGHAEPYRVTWWGIGNEMFGNWQLGNIPVERYAFRHNAFVEAMKRKNPDIRVIGVGSPGRWNDAMLPITAGHMDLLSGHHYTQRRFRAPLSAEDAARYEANFAAYSGSVLEGVKRIVTDFRQRTGQGNAEIDRLRLAIDEWGIVRDWNPTPDGPGLGPFEHYYPLGDALAAARALQELIRSADVVEMANWAQTVNVIGAIKTSRNFAVLDSVGHVLALYRAQVGGKLLPVKLSAGAPVDAVAVLDPKTGRIAFGLVNYSARREVALSFVPAAGTLASRARGWRINGPTLEAISIPGGPQVITTEALPAVDLEQAVRLPAHSITVLSSERGK